jgi:hypothetical protein
MAYTADERETTITLCDDPEKPGMAYISSSQRPWITALLKNPAFEENMEDRETESGRVISVNGLIPIGMITLRKKAKGTIKRSDAGTRKGRPANVATCNGTKTDGGKCNSIAKGDTGFCVKHQSQVTN